MEMSSVQCATADLKTRHNVLKGYSHVAPPQYYCIELIRPKRYAKYTVFPPCSKTFRGQSLYQAFF